jgi:hypothetical protein
MSDLRTVALELVEQSRALVDEIDEFQSPPSRRQIDAVQDRMNGLQRLLNRVQTEDGYVVRRAGGNLVLHPNLQ